MKTPHKHAELIKAWADGAIIQYKVNKFTDIWEDCNLNYPKWHEEYEYRIKSEPKPDIVLYVYFFCGVDCTFSDTPNQGMANGLKVTFDGETGKLKKVEVLE
jgi:hypothetical protein